MELPTHGLFQDLSNQRFGRLIVESFLGRIGRNNQWQCRCDCGVISAVAGGNLKSGHTQSCGCVQKERTSSSVKTHGKTGTDEYRIWSNMKKRCYNKNEINYFNYGGRGIIVCKRWLDSFEAFYEDMGERPSPDHSIDREDNDGNYDPGNCRWATAIEQANNKRNNNIITINGISKTMMQWAREKCLDWSVISSRLKAGKTGEDLILPSTKGGNTLTFNGITDTYVGWSKRTGIKHETISQRIRRDKRSVEYTLTKGATR